MHTISQIAAEAGKMKRTHPRLNRGQLAEALQREVPATSYKEGSESGRTKGRKGYQADNLMWAGLDIAEHGGVMPYRLQVLHEEGYDVRTLPRAHPTFGTGLTGSTYAGPPMHGHRQPRL